MTAARRPAIVSWSGGKDSALLLQALIASPEYEPAALLTTVTEAYDRVAMHGVRRALLHTQAGALRLPLYEAAVPAAADNATYEAAFARALSTCAARHPTAHHVAFGDLFLADVRAYRERLLSELGWKPLFPLWGSDTAQLARRFVRAGFAATICCVDTEQLDGCWAGRRFDDAFLDALPPGVDPCGERGEFHTFVHDGPIFAAPLPVRTGERVLRDGRFQYCDILPDANR